MQVWPRDGSDPGASTVGSATVGTSGSGSALGWGWAGAATGLARCWVEKDFGQPGVVAALARFSRKWHIAQHSSLIAAELGPDSSMQWRSLACKTWRTAIMWRVDPACPANQLSHSRQGQCGSAGLRGMGPPKLLFGGCCHTPSALRCQQMWG